MDIESGRLREIASEEMARPTEVIFRTGEVLEIKGAFFKVQSIFNDGMSITGISKEEGLRSKIASLNQNLKTKE